MAINNDNNNNNNNTSNNRLLCAGTTPIWPITETLREHKENTQMQVTTEHAWQRGNKK
jgi:hypothetical protein